MPRAILYSIIGCSLLLCTNSFGQSTFEQSTFRPYASVSTPIATPIAEERPTLLPVPTNQLGVVSSKSSCRTCATDYNQSYNYLPDQNPDCRGRNCHSSKGECDNRECVWANAAYIFGCTQNLETAGINRDVAHGVRAGIGGWFDCSQHMGLDTSFLTLHDAYHDFVGTVRRNAPVTITTFDANLRGELFSFDRIRIDGLIGYRYLSLKEKLTFISPAGILDQRTTNDFHGGQIGAVANWHFGPYWSELVGKVAFGENREAFILNGAKATQNEFAVVPELNYRFGYHLGEGIRTSIGFSLLYLNEAIRPDSLNSTDFLLLGLTAGIEFRY